MPLFTSGIDEISYPFFLWQPSDINSLGILMKFPTHVFFGKLKLCMCQTVNRVSNVPTIVVKLLGLGGYSTTFSRVSVRP